MAIKEGQRKVAECVCPYLASRAFHNTLVKENRSTTDVDTQQREFLEKMKAYGITVAPNGELRQIKTTARPTQTRGR